MYRRYAIVGERFFSAHVSPQLALKISVIVRFEYFDVNVVESVAGRCVFEDVRG
jgi:hypothetical protein